MAIETVLLTGATGFVGRHVAWSLRSAGYAIRATTRDPERARSLQPWLSFVRCDLMSQQSIEAAMSGTNAAIYLYHGLGTGRRDYPDIEDRAAMAFRSAAEAKRLERVVYLGGVQPKGPVSKHLKSRLHTGQLLRASTVPTVELMASMIVGFQSLSFMLVRDLVVRTPLLVLPKWLDHRSCPVAVCDVAAAIAAALRVPLTESQAFSLPGPDCLTHRRLLEILGAPLGTRVARRPVSQLSPNVAALGLALLSSVPTSISRELVFGLLGDLVPSESSFWQKLGAPPLRSLGDAIADAFSDEVAAEIPSLETRRRIEEKTQDLLRRLSVWQSPDAAQQQL